MADSSKKMEPWQLILILILVLAFFGGLYLVNEALSSKIESLEAAIDAKTDVIKSNIDGVNRRLDQMRAMHAENKAAAPAPAPAAEPAAEPGPDGEAKPIDAEAKAADDGSIPAAPAKKE